MITAWLFISGIISFSAHERAPMIDRLKKHFPKRYRIVSSETGPGIGVEYRSKWHAAFDAAKFDYIEWCHSLPRNNWIVQKVK